MKTINLLSIILVFVGIGLFTSCKKETKIEKNLWNKGGEWNIERLDVKQVSTNPSDSYEETAYSYGSYTFNKDGSGSFTLTVDGGIETGTFTYSNTENQLTLIIDNSLRVFEMDWSKNSLTISITENFTSSGEFISYTQKLTLKKK